MSPRTFSESMGCLREPVESGVAGFGPRAVRQRRWRHLHDRRWRVWVCLSLVHLFLGKLLFAIILFAGLLFARLFFALLVGSRLCSRMKGRLELAKVGWCGKGPPMRADLDCLAVVQHGARLRHGTKSCRRPEPGEPCSVGCFRGSLPLPCDAIPRRASVRSIRATTR